MMAGDRPKHVVS